MIPRQTLTACGVAALTALSMALSTPTGTSRGKGLVGLSVPSRIAEVAPEQAGKIVQVPVQDGQRIAEGEVLFEMNATLERLEVERLTDLARSDLATRRADIVLRHAEHKADRVHQLSLKDIASEREVETATQELELARLDLAQAGLEHAQASNALAQATERLQQRTIRSPFDGIVTRRFKREGEAVEKFVPVVEVMTLDPLWIEFECPITEQQFFRIDETVRVAPAVRPDDVREARVLHVSAKATPSSHTFMVRAAVPNPDHSWKTGLKMVIQGH